MTPRQELIDLAQELLLEVSGTRSRSEWLDSAATLLTQVEDAALERAALWHDAMAQKSREIAARCRIKTADEDYRVRDAADANAAAFVTDAQEHADYATAIRALKGDQ